MPTEFEWDTNKAKSNLIKHGIRFEEAVLVFDDPYHLSLQDPLADHWPCTWSNCHYGRTHDTF